MSSYSKTMLEAAQRWLAANPDPEDPFLRFPIEYQHAARHDNAIERIRKRCAENNIDPSTLPSFAAAVAMVEQQRQNEGAIAELHADILARINQAPKAHHGKYELVNADIYEVDLGRWLLAWARHGYNVFDLSQDFVAAMLLTDPSELDLSTIRLPFGGILVTIPPGFARGVEGTDYTKIHLCEVPHAAIKMLDIGQRVTEIVSQLSPEGRAKVLGDLQAKHRNDKTILDGLSADIYDEIPTQNPATDPETTLLVHATDGVRVLDTMIEQKALSWEAIEALPDEDLADADKMARLTIRQIVFGMLAFLSASREAMTPIETQRKARTKGKSKDGPEPTRWVIGNTIKIDPRLVKAARGGTREAAFQIKRRFIVRGHYRNQAHGPQRSLRTMKWIAPFWKGPEEGARIVHTYQLDETEPT